jgi:hypothetical protein
MRSSSTRNAAAPSKFLIGMHLHRAPHGIHHARELGQEAVAGVLYDAAAVFGDLRLDQVRQVSL